MVYHTNQSINVGAQVSGYAEEVYKRLKEGGFRAAVDISGRTLQYKIRDAKLKEIPYTVILGKNEAEAKTVSIRMRDGSQKNGMSLDELVSQLNDEIKGRKL